MITLFGIDFMPDSGCEWDLWLVDSNDIDKLDYNPAHIVRRFVLALYLLDLSQNKWT